MPEIDAAALTKTMDVWGGTTMTVWVLPNEDGTVAKLWVDASQQSAEYGQKCAAEDFTSQFIGKRAPFVLGENGVDAVSGATTSSQLVVDALNELLAPVATEESMFDTQMKQKTVKGWHDGVVVTVEVDENYVITAVTVDASNEFYALGGKCADEAFTSQFIDKKAPLTLGADIDAVTGATLTSQAVVDAVNELAK